MWGSFVLARLALVGQVAVEYVWPVVLVYVVCLGVMFGLFSHTLVRELLGTFVVWRYVLNLVLGLGLLAVLVDDDRAVLYWLCIPFAVMGAFNDAYPGRYRARVHLVGYTGGCTCCVVVAACLYTKSVAITDFLLVESHGLRWRNNSLCLSALLNCLSLQFCFVYQAWSNPHGFVTMTGRFDVTWMTRRQFEAAEFLQQQVESHVDAARSHA
jgi:hypothetical protein